MLIVNLPPINESDPVYTHYLKHYQVCNKITLHDAVKTHTTQSFYEKTEKYIALNYF